MNYYISDTHFGHENSVKYDAREGSKKFSSVKERDELIIENINKIVTPQDNLYFLGDISWYNPQETTELISRIKCKNLFALKGNHDRILKDGRIKKMFQGIYDVKQIEDDGEKIILCHFPIMMYQGEHRGFIHLYGHLHNSMEETDYQEFLKELDNRIKIRDGDKYKPLRAYNVGCMLDYMNYCPRTLKEIISKNS